MRSGSEPADLTQRCDGLYSIGEPVMGDQWVGAYYSRMCNDPPTHSEKYALDRVKHMCYTCARST